MVTAPKTASVKLDVPIARGDGTIETLEIRRPGPGELRGLKLLDLVQADAQAMITLLPRITIPSLLPGEIETMDLADFIECSNQVAGFLPQQGTSTVSPTE